MSLEKKSHVPLPESENTRSKLDNFVHQFNNLLTAIISNISMAKVDSAPESEQYKILSDSEEAAYAAIEICNGLINTTAIGFSKSEAKDIKEGEISGSKRVLIVDDDRRSGVAMSRMLEHLGCETEWIDSSAVAIRLLGNKNRSFDLVVLDLFMPGTIAATDMLKEIHRQDAKVKVVISSGFLNDPVMVNYRKYGFHGIIRKPYRIDDLNHALVQVLS